MIWHFQFFSINIQHRSVPLILFTSIKLFSPCFRPNISDEFYETMVGESFRGPEGRQPAGHRHAAPRATPCPAPPPLFDLTLTTVAAAAAGVPTGPLWPPQQQRQGTARPGAAGWGVAGCHTNGKVWEGGGLGHGSALVSVSSTSVTRVPGTLKGRGVGAWAGWGRRAFVWSGSGGNTRHLRGGGRRQPCHRKHSSGSRPLRRVPRRPRAAH